MFARFDGERPSFETWEAASSTADRTIFNDNRSSWLPLEEHVATALIAEMANSSIQGEQRKLAEELFKRWLEQYADYGVVTASCQDVAIQINRFLFGTNSSGVSAIHPEEQFQNPSQYLDLHLSILAYQASRSRKPTQMKDYIQLSLGGHALDQVSGVLEMIASQRRNELPEDDQHHLPNSREVVVAEVILRNLVSFGMWKAIQVAEDSRKVALQENRQRAYVGSVALDKEGNVLATAYRGEDPNKSKHSEQILLEKLRELGILERAFIVCVNLEPCLTRSAKHADRGCDRSCSQLLIDAGIPVVGYILSDDNPKQNGHGSERLRQNTIVYAADNTYTRAIASQLQVLQHLRDVSAATA